MIKIVGNYIINNPLFWILLVLIILFIIFYRELKKNTSINKALKRLDKKSYIVLNDVIINSSRKEYAFDTIIISKYGIFIIKYVDYDSKIYGDDRELQWIQLKNNKKVYFDNPVRDLHSNVRVISELLDLNEKYFIPIVCFTKEATLSLDIKDKVTQVEFLDDVIRSYKKEIIKYGLMEIKDTILTSNKVNTNTRVIEKESIDKCPRCGNKLIVRNGKYGDFLGCSNYPDCKYTREL